MIDRIKISEHFYLDEFIPKEIYMQYYNKSIQFISQQIITIAEGIRSYFNTPIIINNWWNNGEYNYSGFRPHDCKIGASESAHKRGLAIDCHFPLGTDYEKIRQVIRDNFDKFRIMGVTTIEKDTPTWLHIDCRNTKGITNGLYEVDFK